MAVKLVSLCCSRIADPGLTDPNVTSAGFDALSFILSRVFQTKLTYHHQGPPSQRHTGTRHQSPWNQNQHDKWYTKPYCLHISKHVYVFFRCYTVYLYIYIYIYILLSFVL